ncbi:MAG TPA: alpha-ketoglutarate-dependent dioxygenase AlkB [Actinomycetota bacterium]|nr:alpha-ketoglutarate-dependent dioxygenase AlkB [Actinomycetota bacterium]
MARSSGIRCQPLGLVYVRNFLAGNHHDQLCSFVASLEYGDVVMHGQAAKRQTVHYGFLYGYESWQLQPGPPIPQELEGLRRRCAELAGMAPPDLDEALVTRYPPGAGIGWHRDAPMFGGKVIGVSLLSESRMRFQRSVGGERYVWDQTLEPASAYVLQDEVRWAWQHSIPAVRSLRYSITFRSVKDPDRWRSEAFSPAAH